MKKILSIALLCTMLLSLAILPSAAADIDVTGRKNVCFEAGIFTWISHFNLAKQDNVDRMFDGIIDRVAADGTQNFADLSIDGGVWTGIFNDGDIDNGDRYNELGDLDPNGKYMVALDFELDKVYTVDTLRVFLDEAENLLIDGFDVMVKDSEDGKWTTIYSVTELCCGKKYKIHEGESGKQTFYVDAQFAPVKALYFRFAVTQARCEKAENTYFAHSSGAHRFFRITELELYEAVEAPATTAAPETTTAAPETTTAAPETTTAAPETTTAAPETTTAAPETTTAAPETTTAAPETTTAPTQTPSTADVMPVICIALMLAAAACLTLRKKFN